MTDVTITDLNRSIEDPVRKTVLKKGKGRDDKGVVRFLYRLDASSDRFDIQFTKAFRLSVAKARKENKLAAEPNG